MASERAKIREELRAKIARGGFFVLVTLWTNAVGQMTH